MTQDPNWKSRIYLVGAIVGTLFGIATSYMYTRSIEEDQAQGGNPKNRLQATDMLWLGTALIGLMTQIAELGRSPESKGRVGNRRK
jgi:hypothetical protein